MDGETRQIEISNRIFNIASVLIIGILLFLVAQVFFQQKAMDNQNLNQITVSGEGKVYAKPDVATVSLGVRIDGNDIKTITSDNVTRVNKIIENLKGLGIEEKDIQTTQYTVTPQYNWTEKGVMVPNGYTIDQSIMVKIRDFSKVSDVFSKATEAGANNVGNLQFTVDDMDTYKDQARAKAIEQAKANAQELARNSGIKLGKIISIYENYTPYYPMMYNKDVAMGMGGAESAVPAPSIQPGQNEIVVSINIAYQVK